MSLLRPVIVPLACLALVAIASAIGGIAACSHDTALHFAPEAGLADAAADAGPSGPTIPVTTLAPALTSAAAAKTSATWAAYRLDDGEWKVLAASAVGTYGVPIPINRWAIALVCASDDDQLSTVFIHRRTVATRSLEVSLEAQCAPEPPVADLALAGTLSNLPPTTQWLDFGYARDSRGVVIGVPVNGKASYEELGIAPGTWDLGFGIRDDSFGPLTRMVILRAEVVNADRTLDIDGVGPASFVPGTKRFVLRGLDAADSITPRVLYAAGGPSGVDVGPQDVPVGTSEVTLVYSTVPEAKQLASDRYRGAITAERDRREALRTIDFSIHQAIDVDVTLPPIIKAPTVVVVGTAPQVRLETRFPALARAVLHEAIVRAETNRRTQHVWHATFDAAVVAGSAEVVDTTPDLSALTGFKSAWALPVGVSATVTARMREMPESLGDGTVQRATGNSTTVTP